MRSTAHFTFESLDTRTRQIMLDELSMDLAGGRLCFSTRFTPAGHSAYPGILHQAITTGNDATLAHDLLVGGFFSDMEIGRSKTGKTFMRRVPENAHEIFAEGEFNRFYLRALCVRRAARQRRMRRNLSGEGGQHSEIRIGAKDRHDDRCCRSACRPSKQCRCRTGARPAVGTGFRVECPDSRTHGLWHPDRFVGRVDLMETAGEESWHRGGRAANPRRPQSCSLDSTPRRLSRGAESS